MVTMWTTFGNCGNDLALGLDVNLCVPKTQGSGVVKKTLNKNLQYNFKIIGKLSENTNFNVGLGSVNMELQTCNVSIPNNTRKFIMYNIYTDIIRNVSTLLSNRLTLHCSTGISYMNWDSISTGVNSSSYLKALHTTRLKYKWDPTNYNIHQGVSFRLGTGITYKYTNNFHFKATTIYSNFITTQHLFRSLITYGIGMEYYL
jgi:hypothetical protein